MIILGIESTAHTFGVGIVRDKDPFILADVRANYVPKEGGIHPREASRFFATKAHEVIKQALEQARISINDINAIAVALGPGLGPCLRVGATIARALASFFNKPLVPVNHSVAHVEIGLKLTGARDPVIVYLAGGNTMIIAFNDKRYRVFGETLDIALGNLIDVFAREVGLAPPYVRKGVHVVDECADKGSKLLDLPYIVKGQDVSFSGLLTAALKHYKTGKYRLEDICYTLREIAYSMVVEVSERALAHTSKNEVLLVGGVAASRRLQEKFKLMAKIYDASVHVVPPRYAVDNGVMIAWTGLLAYKHGVVIPVEKAVVRQRWRLDEVEIPWRS